MKAFLVACVLVSLASSQTPTTNNTTYVNDLLHTDLRRCIWENCTLSKCDCGYIIRNESLEYDEDKLDGCLSRDLFLETMESCSDGNKVRPIEGIANVTDNIVSNPPITRIMRYFFWITGVLVITGNAYVIINSVVKTSCFKQAWPSVSLQCNHIVILNIAVADFIMGIYLITISILNAVKFESNNLNHIEWMGSLSCSIVGSLALISSEASCFLMLTLTSFRLYHVYRPLSSMTASSWSWRVCIFLSWFVAVFLGVFPMLEINSEYFIDGYIVKTSSGFTVVPNILIDYITCSLVSLDRSHYSKNEFISELEYINKHFSRNAALVHGCCLRTDQFNYCLKSYLTYQDFKDDRDHIKQKTSFLFVEAPRGRLGFYNTADTCLPKFFTNSLIAAWEYSIAILTLNLACFTLIAVSYILIYIRSTKKRQINAARTIDLQKREAKMQKRIARIIITDFVCWVPICIMAYVQISPKYSFSSVELLDAFAGFVLPINSALNPFLYSVNLSKLFKRLRYQVLNKCRN